MKYYNFITHRINKSYKNDLIQYQMADDEVYSEDFVLKYLNYLFKRFDNPNDYVVFIIDSGLRLRRMWVGYRNINDLPLCTFEPLNRIGPILVPTKKFYDFLKSIFDRYYIIFNNTWNEFNIIKKNIHVEFIRTENYPWANSTHRYMFIPDSKKISAFDYHNYIDVEPYSNFRNEIMNDYGTYDFTKTEDYYMAIAPTIKLLMEEYKMDIFNYINDCERGVLPYLNLSEEDKLLFEMRTRNVL